MSQYGFFIDQSRCIGCNSCVIACKQWQDIPPGPIKWMRVYQWETGLFPDTRLHILPIMCFHCENAVCVKACPNGAIYKEEKYGAVLMDSQKCRGARKCWQACPYGTPQYEGDGIDKKMSKCNMCIDRLNQGLKPICVMSCSMRALEFGVLDELIKKYGNLKRLEEMPKETITRPAVVFKPSEKKRTIVNWNPMKALELWQKRQSHLGKLLPDVFTETFDVTEAPRNIVGHNKLVLKARNSEELMYYTTDNE